VRVAHDMLYVVRQHDGSLGALSLNF
jgi:hypothetical protein